MDDASDRLARLRERLTQAAARSGRSAAEVRLLAVSKKKSVEAIREVHEAGCREFGENYAQELLDKAEALRDLTDLRWHFIGHLQSKKVRLLVDRVALIHGVDRIKLIQEIDKRAGAAERVVDVLVQVSLVGERSKGGCQPDELPHLLEAAERCAHLRLRGLMTMPPFSEDPEEARPHFRRLRELRDQWGGGERLPELSMGMSNDFEQAIEEGATIVRVGTAIFGPR